MTKLLQEQLKNLPSNPGVYEFYNKDGRLLYVGKAKSLKKRVISYFRTSSNLTAAKMNMVNEITEIKTSVVDSENEALLLENNLIKQHQPPYNIVLKDDKNWLYIAIDSRETYPRVDLTRRRLNKGYKYYGPYTSAFAARTILYSLKKILGLRTCNNPPEKPCFDSKLGRCLGHNFNKNSQATYKKQLTRLHDFLTGNGKKLAQELSQKMFQASTNKRFEQATIWRNQLTLLNRLLDKQKIVYHQNESFDVINLEINRQTSAINLLVVRHGQLIKSDQVLLGHKDMNEKEILTDFIGQYYPQVTDKPKLILTPIKISSDFNTIVPTRGKKSQLLKLAKKNAENYLHNSLAMWQKKSARSTASINELQKVLNLKRTPNRIEGYDISNIQGNHAVGSMVVATSGLIDKSQYRKFTIKTVKGANDVAMMAEVLTRRLKNKQWPKPDLIMLDGGKPQLNTIIKLFIKKRVKLPLVSLAKREEILFSPDKKHGIKLPDNSPALLLLEELRDEAHRFGITFYRSKHRRSLRRV